MYLKLFQYILNLKSFRTSKQYLQILSALFSFVSCNIVTRMKFNYKLVFFLFRISSVYSTAGIRCSRTKYLVAFMSMLILLFHVYVTINFINTRINLVLMIFFAFTNFFYIIFRVRLSRKLNELKRISKIVSSMDFEEGKSANSYLYLWIVLNLLSILLNFISLVTYYYEQKTISNMFGIPENKTVLIKFAVVLYAYYKSFFIRLPLNTFAIYFVLVCNHVRYVLENMSRKLNTSPVSYTKLMQSYNSFQKFINFLDDELSFFVLCETIYVNHELLFAIHNFLHSTGFLACPFCLEGLSFLGTFINIVIFFIAMCASACMVSEAYSDLCTQVKTLVENMDSDDAYRLLKFRLFVEKEVHFTMWKIVPVNRSFVLCTFGAIFTYIMLLDNLMYN